MPARKPPKSKSVQPPPPVAPARGHRPAYAPTAAARSQVAAMVIADIGQDMIAACLRISGPTLRKHFRRELTTSYAIIKAEIAGKLVTLARGGDAKAAMFYLETHGWVRSERLVVADGGVDDSDLSTLSDAQIEAKLRQLEGAGRRRRA